MNRIERPAEIEAESVAIISRELEAMGIVLEGGSVPSFTPLVYTDSDRIRESYPGQYMGEYTLAFVRSGDPEYASPLTGAPLFFESFFNE